MRHSSNLETLRECEEYCLRNGSNSMAECFSSTLFCYFEQLQVFFHQCVQEDLSQLPKTREGCLA